MKLLKETWHRFGAEVIFITSNMQGNDEMMQGCRAGTVISIMIYGVSLTYTTQLVYTHLARCGTSSGSANTPSIFIRRCSPFLPHDGTRDADWPRWRTQERAFVSARRGGML
jgi:hypothetical protein